MKVAMECFYFGEKQAACLHGAEVAREAKEQSCSGESNAEQEQKQIWRLLSLF